ncbi:MAG: T9SS type A sorting domain-containing protein [Candidatus Kapabacteria bacterium]|nr:T9SS type A sorting domain-containing protein [Candidatus Kapabacteria bacterium]
MKTFLLALLALFLTSSAYAGEIGVVFNALMNGRPLVMGTPVRVDNGKYFFSPRFLQYYVSDISFVHDGGKRTKAEEIYLLVNAKDAPRYVVGSYDITNIDSIEFHIGVSYMSNHSDPSLYPPEHPLALKEPSMHWGWAAGYRFIVLEGSAGSTAQTATADVQLHSVGDTLYRRITLPVNSTKTDKGVDVVLNAEYGSLLQNIDASLGIVLHGLGEETIVMTENMATLVFSPANSTSVQDNAISASNISINPNPSSDVVTIAGGISEADVRIVDMAGRLVATTSLRGGLTTFSVASLPVGSYTVLIGADNGRITRAPLSIVR